jgi:integrase
MSTAAVYGRATRSDLDLRRDSAAPPLLGPYLDERLAESVRLSVRPKTYVSYRSIVRIHLIPALGHIPVAELRPLDVQGYLNAKAASGLAPRTVAYHRKILRQALGHAERVELVGRNVANLARPPRIPRREVRPLSPEEARSFLCAIAGDRLEALHLLAIGCGLRQGEIPGLRWSDVDLEAGTVRSAPRCSGWRASSPWSSRSPTPAGGWCRCRRSC